MIGKLIKYLIFLGIIGAIAIAGYALFFELPPPSEEIIISVTPNGV